MRRASVLLGTLTLLLAACNAATSDQPSSTSTVDTTGTPVQAACATIADYADSMLGDYTSTKPEAWFGHSELLRLVDPNVGDGQFQLAITALSAQSVILGTRLEGQLSTQPGDLIGDEVKALDQACAAAGYGQ